MLRTSIKNSTLPPVSPTSRAVVDFGGWTKAKPHEIQGVLWSFAYFFCLLCSFYLLRPLREEMGIQAGVDNLKWAFSATFGAMLLAVPLYGWAATRYARAKLLPLVYLFFIVNLLVFYALLKNGIAPPPLPHMVPLAFFIWVSVFNLFVVSVFWSFMADIYDSEQAGRLFGFIAAGGTLGAIAGPALAAALASASPLNLLLIAAALLSLALVCIQRLSRWSTLAAAPGAAPAIRGAALGGSIWGGITSLRKSRYLLGICLFIVLYTTLSTFLYFEQARIVADAYDEPKQRTALFALIDLAVNVLTLATQIFVTGRIVDRFGLPITLALIPALTAVGFAALGFAPVLAALVAFQIARRAGEYAIARPAREMLFTVVDREAKYKSKSVIDTVVYRGGDAAAGWLFSAIAAAGASLAAIAWIAVPVSAIWMVTGYGLGIAARTKARQQSTSDSHFGHPNAGEKS
ncbi:MAG: MFS transporter [Burkholderiales bacterium]|nr:MFS transporter [Burkholderiales bacterium]